MVQIAQNTDLQQQITWALGLVQDAWDDIPELAEDWPVMDTAERLTYFYGWAIPRMWLRRLYEWSDEMTPEQAVQFAKLQERIRELQPILDRLLAA